MLPGHRVLQEQGSHLYLYVYTMFISTLAAPGGRPLLRHGGLRPLGQEQQDQQPQLRVQTVPVGGPAADRARVPVRDSVTRDT